MTEDRTKIVAKIRALLAKTEDAGCSEDEALAAAAKAGELMDKYELTESDIELTENKGQIKSEERYQNRTNAHEARFTLGAIGEFTKTVAYMSEDSVCFVGFSQDREIAFYLYDLIKNAMDVEFRRFLKSPDRPDHIHGRTLRASFMRGMATRISERLREMTRQRAVDQAQLAKGQGAALVVVKQKLIRQHMADIGLRLTSSRGRYRYIESGHAAGRAAGARVNLTTGIHGNPGNRYLN